MKRNCEELELKAGGVLAPGIRVEQRHQFRVKLSKSDINLDNDE